MDALFPHLFDRETVLVEMAVAKDGPRGGPASGGNTLREVDGAPELRVHQHVAIPAASGPRLAKAKVFYLTSKRTRSAGEHFALALQRTHRGTLIGERTAGANHFGAIEPIGAGLVAFIPVGRTYDPDTGKDWEGTGIVPDITMDQGTRLAKGEKGGGTIPTVREANLRRHLENPNGSKTESEEREEPDADDPHASSSGRARAVSGP